MLISPIVAVIMSSHWAAIVVLLTHHNDWCKHVDQSNFGSHHVQPLCSYYLNTYSNSQQYIFCFTRIDYSDLSTELGNNDDQYKAKSVYEPAAFAFKNLKIFGASAYLDEFHEAARTLPPGFDTESPESPPPSPTSGLSSSSLSPCLNGIVDEFAKSNKSSLLPPTQIGNFSGHLEIKVKLKQNVSVPGSKVQ